METRYVGSLQISSHPLSIYIYNIKQLHLLSKLTVKPKIPNRNSESMRMEPGLACKKHSIHKQLQGVCPFCLRERLSQLLAAAASQVSHSLPPPPPSQSSSPANYYSPPASSSNNKSPRGHNRNASDISGSISFMLSVGSSGGLKKSRSLAFVPRNFVGELKTGKKKKGFWSKLLHRERKKDVFMQC